MIHILNNIKRIETLTKIMWNIVIEKAEQKEEEFVLTKSGTKSSLRALYFIFYLLLPYILHSMAPSSHATDI